MRRLGIVLGCGGIALAAFAPGAGAATIVVDEFDDPVPGIDLGCNIRDAIESANDNADFPGCESTGGYGAAPDTILIPGGTISTLDRNTPVAAPGGDNDNVTGDLDIEGPLTITATGSGLATIDAQDTLSAGGMPDFTALDRVLHIESNAGAVTLNRLRITGGLTANGGGTPTLGGGGILTEAPLTITDSEIVENVAREYNVNFSALGGGIMVRGSLARLTMSGSTVADNEVQTAEDFNIGSAIGGGIAAFPVVNGQPAPLGVDITNSTISGNRAVGQTPDPGGSTHSGVVGGIFAANGPFPGFDRTTVNLTNVTVTGNQAISEATPANGVVGGVQIAQGTTTGSIIAGNTDTASASSFEDCGLSNTSGGGNLIGRRSAAPENACAFSGPNDLVGGTTAGTAINPNIGTLLNNGGLTRTHLLNPGSPAINRGGSCPATDQTGLFRYIAAPCDAGALEIGATATPPPSTQPTVTPPVTPPGPTGQRAAALAKCKKIKKKKAKRKCRAKANKLPV